MFRSDRPQSAGDNNILQVAENDVEFSDRYHFDGQFLSLQIGNGASTAGFSQNFEAHRLCSTSQRHFSNWQPIKKLERAMEF
jgi:hypothetical protein